MNKKLFHRFVVQCGNYWENAKTTTPSCLSSLLSVTGFLSSFIPIIHVKCEVLCAIASSSAVFYNSLSARCASGMQLQMISCMLCYHSGVFILHDAKMNSRISRNALAAMLMFLPEAKNANK